MNKLHFRDLGARGSTDEPRGAWRDGGVTWQHRTVEDHIRALLAAGVA